MKTRPALPTDAIAMSDLIKRWSHTFLDPSLSANIEAFYQKISPRSLAQMVQNKEFVVLVAEDNGAFQGFITLKNGTHISQFFIEERVQRRGVGRRLWLAANETTTARTFTVNANVSAVQFYEKLGFNASAGRTTQGALVFVPMHKHTHDA